MMDKLNLRSVFPMMMGEIFMKRLALFTLSMSVTVSGCSVFQKNSKKAFNDGFYTQNIDGIKQRDYIDVADEIIQIHPSELKENGKSVINKENIYEFKKRNLNTNT